MITISRSQISIVNIQCGYYPLEKSLDDAARADVGRVGLWGAAPHFHLEDMTYTDARRIRKQTEEGGLSLTCYTLEQYIYPMNLAADLAIQRRYSLKYFEDSLHATAELGTDKMSATTGWGYLDNNNINEAWRHAREGLMPLGDMTRDYGIKLALEVLCRDENSLAYNLPILKGMTEDLSHPAIRVMIDTISITLASEWPEDYLRVFGKQLVYMHFIDGAPKGRLAWGDGVLDMKEYLEEFSRYSYRGYLPLETTDGRYRVDPTSPALQSAERLYDVLGRRP